MLPENAEPYRMVGATVKAGPGPEALEGAGGRLSRGCGDVCRVSDPTTVTLRSRGRSSVMGADVTIPGRISSAIILASAVRTAAAPTVKYFFPCLEYRAVNVMCGELGIEEGETIFKGGKTPPEAVSGRATYTTAAAKKRRHL